MADREINCEECHTYLGVIRDAKLKKGMVHICEKCNTKRLAAKAKERIDNAAYKPYDPMEAIKDMMNGCFK